MKTSLDDLSDLEQTLQRRMNGFLGNVIQGKSGCELLKRCSRKWRETEWPGFLFEEIVRRKIFGGIDGPYEADSFYRVAGPGLPIECKTHRVCSKPNALMLNSVDNTNALLDEYKRILVIVGFYKAQMDKDGSFRRWHEEFKGGKVTNYQGAYHRVMKAAVMFTHIKCFILDERLLPSCSVVNRGLGSSKFKIDIGKIPAWQCSTQITQS